MNIEEIKRHTEEKIKQLIKEFKGNPEKFLTEEDARSYLYHLLLDKFNALENTIDKTKSIPVHCEVRWYGNSGGLKFRSDIIIFDVSTLKTKNTVSFKLPSKGYAVSKPQVAIEIKLRRKAKKSDKVFREDIEEDRKKLSQIRNDLNTDLYSYLIAFDKKDDICFEICNTENHKEYYVYPYENNRVLAEQSRIIERV